MSISKLASSFAIVLLMTISVSAQNNGIDYTSSRIVPHVPVAGDGCNQGCGFGCNQNCVPADQLWAGFASSTNCKGCVRTNKLRPNLPGFGGFPACNLTECQTIGRIGIPMPTVSLNWPRPMHLPCADCNSLRPRLHDAFNIFGCGKQKNVRCDIQNDCFGKMGESQSSFQALPSAIYGSPAPKTSASSTSQDIPPAPVVEPVLNNVKTTSVDNAKRFSYGKKGWSR